MNGTCNTCMIQPVHSVSVASNTIILIRLANSIDLLPKNSNICKNIFSLKSAGLKNSVLIKLQKEWVNMGFFVCLWTI